MPEWGVGMTGTIIRPGQHIYAINGPQIIAPRGAPAKWWLAGGSIPGADCIAAYQGKGAASLVASFVNLANPGIYDLTESGGAATWTSDGGWQFFNTGAIYLETGILSPNPSTWAIRWSDSGGDTSGGIFGQLGAIPTRDQLSPNRGGAGFIWANGYSNTEAGFNYNAGVAIARPGYLLLNGDVHTGSGRPGGAGTTIAIGYLKMWGPQASKIQAFAEYNVALTNDQMVALAAAMVAF